MDFPPGYTAQSIALICGVHPSTIYRAFAGETKSVQTAKSIESATGGLIKWTDFFEGGASSPQVDPPSEAKDSAA